MVFKGMPFWLACPASAAAPTATDGCVVCDGISRDAFVLHVLHKLQRLLPLSQDMLDVFSPDLARVSHFGRQQQGSVTVWGQSVRVDARMDRC